MGANSTFKKKSCTKLFFDAIAALAGVDNNGKLNPLFEKLRGFKSETEFGACLKTYGFID